MNRNKCNIGIISFSSTAGDIPLTNLVALTRALADHIYLVAIEGTDSLFEDDKRCTVCLVRHRMARNTFARILNYFWLQLKISAQLVKRIADTDLWIFFIGGETLLIPSFIVRLFKSTLVLVLAGAPEQGAKIRQDTLSRVSGILSRLNFTLANKIVAYSDRIRVQRNLKRYGTKVVIAHEHFVDAGKFAVKKQFSERERTLVGFIGRLSREKGVLEFIQAIPALTQERSDLRFLIGGTGELAEAVVLFTKENGLEEKIVYSGWIPHDEVPDYLNQLTLLVIPSYTEGLPNLMLEAMACGTPVLASAVGAIEDIIRDGETGFILRENSPKCIAEDVLRVLVDPSVSTVLENARSLIVNEFSYQKNLQTWKKILRPI
jgi:glycosyltransferase involved in cell wall biosynthesis